MYQTKEHNVEEGFQSCSPQSIIKGDGNVSLGKTWIEAFREGSVIVLKEGIAACYIS
jgi:hypothetical protein